MPSRRDFVKTAAMAAYAGPAALPKRPLGATGLQVSVLGLGGAGIGMLADGKPAADVVRRCYDLGITYFDAAAAAAYGLAQVRYGEALRDVRDRIVLATKTRNRTYTQAEVDLNQSLQYLRTDRIDLYQLHNITNDEDIEFIFGPRGVMELVEKAKKAGKIRFVGVTGHTEPGVLNRILSRYEFATVLMPLSVTDGASGDRSFERGTLPVARNKNVGVIAMKTLGAGRILQQKTASLEESVRYVISLPIATAIMGCRAVSEVETAVALARNAKPLTASEMENLRARVAQGELAALEPWKKRAAPEYHAD